MNGLYIYIYILKSMHTRKQHAAANRTDWGRILGVAKMVCTFDCVRAAHSCVHWLFRTNAFKPQTPILLNSNVL